MHVVALHNRPSGRKIAMCCWLVGRVAFSCFFFLSSLFPSVSGTKQLAMRQKQKHEEEEVRHQG